MIVTINRSARIIVSIVIAALAAAAVYYWLDNKDENLQQVPPPGTSNIALSAWLADWTGESAVKEAKYINERLSSLQLFAIYFNEKHELYIRNDFDKIYKEMKQAQAENNELKLYATIVNDLIQADGTSSQKDTGLVSQLLADSDSRKAHIIEIVQLLDRYELDGIEIDYERIADNDWQHAVPFFKQLYHELEQRGKELRIVLETRAPIEQLELPQGPEYVIMAYNLHGFHNDAGPKANVPMIRKIAARIDHLPGPVTIAFAAGGFNWREDGRVEALTELQALHLANNYKAVQQRDADSGAQSFTYKDAEGMKHEVWYADADTLKLWISTAIRAGIGQIAIWRMGELDQLSLDYLRQL